MSLPQALALAALVLEWEAENVDQRQPWAKECTEAAALLRQANPSPPPEWVSRRDVVYIQSPLLVPMD